MDCVCVNHPETNLYLQSHIMVAVGVGNTSNRHSVQLSINVSLNVQVGVDCKKTSLLLVSFVPVLISMLSSILQIKCSMRVYRMKQSGFALSGF